VTSPLEYAHQIVHAPAVRDDPAPLEIGEQTLRYLGLDPRSVESQALVLVCRRYRLDPLLGHVDIIDRGRGRKPYVTRDGYLEIAHRSGQLDGIVVDEERRNTTSDGWTAYVSVWRRDMSHPFRYGAQCKDGEALAKQGNGPEMALARAERRALKRAFNIPSFDGFDDDDEGPPASVADETPAVSHQGPSAPASTTEIRGREASAENRDRGTAALGARPAPDRPAKPRIRSAAQLEKIRAILLVRGVTDDENAAPILSQIVGRPVARAGDPQITYDEATTIIAKLEGAAEGGDE